MNETRAHRTSGGSVVLFCVNQHTNQNKGISYANNTIRVRECEVNIMRGKKICSDVLYIFIKLLTLLNEGEILCYYDHHNFGACVRACVCERLAWADGHE